MGMHLASKVAGRTFKAMCGCVVQKGEVYVTFTDYVMWNRVYESSCVGCWNKGNGIKFVDGEFQADRERFLPLKMVVK